MKFALRLMAVASVATLLLSTFASQAQADPVPVPEGCAGAGATFVCTGSATPPTPGAGNQVPINFTVGGQQVFDPIYFGGPVGGVIIPVTTTSTTVGGTTYVGGPVGPFNTGITAPTTLCLFVVQCIVAGSPVTVPGTELPLVPVTLPQQTVDPIGVPVPVIDVIGTYYLSGQVPVVASVATTVTVYNGPLFVREQAEESIDYARDHAHPANLSWELARALCTQGGGVEEQYTSDREYRFCRGASEPFLKGSNTFYDLGVTLS